MISNRSFVFDFFAQFFFFTLVRIHRVSYQNLLGLILPLSLRRRFNLRWFLFIHFIREISHLSLLPTSILLQLGFIAIWRSQKLYITVIARFLDGAFHHRFILKGMSLPWFTVNIGLRYQLTMTLRKVHTNFNFSILHSLIHLLNRILLLSINLHLLIFTWHHVNNWHFDFLWVVLFQKGMRSIHFVQKGFRRSGTLKLFAVFRIQRFFWILCLDGVHVCNVSGWCIWMNSNSLTT